MDGCADCDAKRQPVSNMTNWPWPVVHSAFHSGVVKKASPRDRLTARSRSRLEDRSLHRVSGDGSIEDIYPVILWFAVVSMSSGLCSMLHWCVLMLRDTEQSPQKQQQHNSQIHDGPSAHGTPESSMSQTGHGGSSATRSATLPTRPRRMPPSSLWSRGDTIMPRPAGANVSGLVSFEGTSGSSHPGRT